MRERRFTLKAADGHLIGAVEWLPQGLPVRCVLHILHGMAEHCLRYRDFARFLCARGVAVYAHDHRGHGLSIGAGEAPGHFADDEGWERVLQDLLQVNRAISALHPGIPIALLGHSMGSFVARAYLLRHGHTLAALVLSATGWRYGAVAGLMRTVARWDARRRGARRPSGLMAALAMGSFNLPFFPARTPCDWLSRDSAQVDAYMADPLCGLQCSAGLWADLFGGIAELEAAEAAGRRLPKLPVLLLAGTRDPVSMAGRGVKQLAARYRAAGLDDVQVALYSGGRHEMLNETNRQQVYEDIGAWLALRFELAPLPLPLAEDGAMRLA